MPVELHCHTVFSVDGRCTPEQVVDVAAECGITTLSITEHNHLGSLERAAARAAERGIRYLAGVELDADWNGQTYHFLAFGFDVLHPQIRRLIEQNHAKYVSDFDLYVEALEASEHPVTRTRLEAGLAERYPTNPAPAMTQWFARDFLVDQGVFPDANAYNRTLRDLKQKIIYERGPAAFKSFATFETAAQAVHRAGGVLLLAHVAHNFPGDQAGQIALIDELIEQGMDGFELYHPKNLAEPHFDQIARHAERLGCVISGGSDCHDAPNQWPYPLGSACAPDLIMMMIESALTERRAGGVQSGASARNIEQT